MKISVALCTYNGLPYVTDQLESIKKQSLQADELVVSDDGSDDGTFPALKQALRTFPFPTRLYQPTARLGTTRHFEFAIAQCTGDIIVLCDQDDVWAPNKLEMISACFTRYPAVGLVFSDGHVVHSDLRPRGDLVSQAVGLRRWEKRAIARGEGLTVLLRHNVVPGATLAFRSRFQRLIRPIPEICQHDAWIALLLSAVSGMVLIPQPLILYRQHPNQQIGEARMTIAKKFRNAKTLNRGLARQRFQLAYDRLLQCSEWFPCHANVLRHLEEKIAHLTVTSTMPPQIWGRIPIVSAEFLKGRYHRYSWGIQGALADLVLFKPA